MEFKKYHGTGNDFIMVDDRENKFPIDNHEYIASLCHRRFGIGADGLICLRLHSKYDFEMVYFNSDGRQSSMCGNGGRCIVRFAHDLGLIDQECSFLAIDGAHEARVVGNEVSLKMIDVNQIDQPSSGVCVLNTGSPHYVSFIGNVDIADMVKEGESIRYSEPYVREGINVNLVEKTTDGLKMRTYERGVEAETYSCGTGVTAAALAHAEQEGINEGAIPVETRGGNLTLSFKKTQDGYRDVYLQGPVTYVFSGIVS